MCGSAHGEKPRKNALQPPNLASAIRVAACAPPLATGRSNSICELAAYSELLAILLISLRDRGLKISHDF